MADNETIEDIITEMHRFAEQHEYDHPDMDTNAQGIMDYADRLEAAHRRERGDVAKLREALKRAWLFVSATRESFAFVHEGRIERDKLCEDIDAALSAPPRNCDLPKVLEDPWRAWLDDESNWEEGYPKLEIHDWLLAPATEKEGGAK